MTLSPGARLGPYEVLDLIGAGGMGEVYRARDTRLDRTVAVKVLPSDFANDPSRRARFEREARAISALEHPHICTLHDVGEQEGLAYLVMEHLTGETLAGRLRKGPLPRSQALEVASQIADALDAAHKRGIVHRDLKPSNVMLTGAGVKLLDFGLARVMPGAGAVESTSPTLTGTGAVLGTAPYMSPEQVEGREADTRSDIWSLGVVLYEMLTGRRAFAGTNSASLIGAILERDPVSLTTLQPLTPPSLERLVRRCLAKSPDARWGTAHDLADELRWVAQGAGVTGDVGPQVLGRVPTSRLLAVTAIAAALIGLVVGLPVGLRFARPPSRGPVRSLLEVRPAEALGSPHLLERVWGTGVLSRTDIALAPDGRVLVFAGRQGERLQLFRRGLADPEAEALPGTDGADSPFFSRDGRWVGFWAAGAIWKIAVDGKNPPVELCRMPALFGASWGPDDRIVFAQRTGGLSVVPAAGGKVESLTTLEPTEVSHRLPHLLPNGQIVLFTVLETLNDWFAARVDAIDLRTGQRRTLARDAADAHYLAGGHVVFARRGSIVAAPFDTASLRRTGGEFGALDGVMQSVNTRNPAIDTGAAQFAVSDAATLAYVPGGIVPDQNARLVVVDRSGAVQALDAPQRPYISLRLSPDGRRLAVQTQEGLTRGVWVHDFAKKTWVRPVPDPGGPMLFPRWSPDGQQLAFAWNRSGTNSISLVDVDGSRPPERLIVSRDPITPSCWLPDSQSLLFVSEGLTPAATFPGSGFPAARPDGLGAGADIWLLTRAGSAWTSRPLLQTQFSESHPELSPDGRWLAYTSDETGRTEVYVRRFPDLGGKVQISTQGGTSALWSRDGRELFYAIRSDLGWYSLIAVDVRAGAGMAFSTGPQHTVFAARELTSPHGEPRRLYTTTPVGGFDVSPDGRGFLFVQLIQAPTAPPIQHVHLVQDWPQLFVRPVTSQ